ncbi:MAG: helix-turn-helix domain-containing protein [Candidatus Woesearchaeota archaeon]|nr:helix-turn-helix domain-containing protein [Candidatus Woesearchaeota archaeon]
MHVLQGSAENKRRFIADLQKDPGIHKIEISGNHFFTLNKEPLKKQYYHPIFDQRIIQPRPTVQRSDGFEDWELACWKREPLTRITEVPVFDVTIQSIQEIPITDVFFPTLYPKLSEKQREAVETAVAHGYYDHPRGAYLADLAKHTKTTRQNFQEHLRKAERKIMPFLSENVLH